MSERRDRFHGSHPWAESKLAPKASPPKVYSPVDLNAFKKGMRQLSAAVTVVTTGLDAQRRAGLTATAVCSVSAEPPLLLACINRQGAAYARILEWGNFCVNVLSHDQIGIAKRFAGLEGGPHPERFEHAQWETLATGAPVLAGCLANFDCRVHQEIASGTHSIFIGAIAAISVNKGQEPLAFLNGQYLKLETGRRIADATLWDWS